MPKYESPNQSAGEDGEQEFERWAQRLMLWPATKLSPDRGIDYTCQVLERLQKDENATNTGELFSVNVRSTTEESDVVHLNRADAELILQSNTHFFIAIVKRSHDPRLLSRVAVQFIDESFLRKLVKFLCSKNKKMGIKFSDALEDPNAIKSTAKEILQFNYRDYISLNILKILHLPENGNFDAELRHSRQINSLCIFDRSSDEKQEYLFSKESLSSLLIIKSAKDSVSLEELDSALSQGLRKLPTIILENLDEHINKMLVHHQIWNFAAALSIARKIEKSGLALNPSSIVALSRIYLTAIEVGILDRNPFLQETLQRLTELESGLEDVQTFIASAKSLSGETTEAISILKKQESPTSKRILLGIFITTEQWEEANSFISSNPVQKEWVDLSIALYASNGEWEKALRLLHDNSLTNDKITKLKCISRFAKGIIHWLSKQTPLSTKLPNESKSPLFKEVIFEIGDAIQEIDEPNYNESELHKDALLSIWKLYHSANSKARIDSLTRTIRSFSPIPIETGHSILGEYSDYDETVARRIKTENKSIEAHALSIALRLRHDPEDSNARLECIELANNLGEASSELTDFIYHILFSIIPFVPITEKNEFISLLQNIGLKALIDDDTLQATVSLLQGDQNTAIDLLREVEGDLFKIQLLTNSYLQNGNKPQALSTLKKGLAIYRSPQLLRQVADLSVETKNIAEAIVYYNELLEIDPNYIDCHNNLAILYSVNNFEHHKLVKHLEHLCTAQPDNDQYKINLAAAYCKIFEVEKSIELFHSLCNTHKSNLEYHLRFALVLHNSGRSKEAFELLKPKYDEFSTDEQFCITFSTIAFASGDESYANTSLQHLIHLERNNDTGKRILEILPEEQGLEKIKDQIQKSGSSVDQMLRLILGCRWPWTSTQEVIQNRTPYLEWAFRTQKYDWISDRPISKASFCIYCSNSCHPLTNEIGHKEVIELECSPQGSSVIFDISSIITAFELGILDHIFDYFSVVYIPETYLEHSLDHIDKLNHHQRSSIDSAINIKSKINQDLISISSNSLDHKKAYVIDEYTDKKPRTLNILDIISPLQKEGLIDDKRYYAISRQLKPATLEALPDDFLETVQ